jgi:molecular chaperone DnaJ
VIDFLDGIHGCDKEIELNKRLPCKVCNGRRADMTNKPRICFECGGRGTVIGNYGIRKKCIKCDGCGCTPKTRCGECEGLGV